MISFTKRTAFTCVFMLIILSSAIPASCAASPDNSEMSAYIIDYMKAEYLDENLVHPARTELCAYARSYMGLDPLEEDDSVIKIATPNIVKAEAFYDYYVGIFSHLSNMPLMQMTSTGSLIGQTAESYEVSEDNTAWTFYIKDDMYWSDGRKVTPEDIEFTFQYIGTKIASSEWIGESLVSTSVSDEDNSVTFVFDQPYTNLNLEFATYNVIPKHIWENIDDPEGYTSSGPYVGCGPYYLEEINLDSAKLTYKKNPHWKGTEPNFENVEIHWFASDSVACMALESGSMDTYYRYANSYPYANVDELLETGDFDVDRQTSIGLTFMAFNLESEPLSDPAFRNAISYAVNYDEIITYDTNGYGQVPNKGFVPPGMDYYKNTDALEYNVNTAKSLIADAGYVDSDNNGIVEDSEGNDITLELLIRDGYDDTAKLMEEYLEDAGVDVEVTQVDSSTWFDRKDNYEYDLTLSGATPWGMLMHAGWGTGYLDNRRTGKGVLHILGDQEFLTLCDNILATTDQDELEQYASDMQDYYATEMPILPLYWKEVVTPYNKHFTGWHYNPLFGIYNLDTFLNVKQVAAA
ncbi:ABC transporter substrate-binding protein [uncultured Methanolobus sp.]|uniref:ABC transporter substrate-binding protein n=1 Tax=uncultured Methanolobus sp. TaxID=218300 RepID=UPI002AAADCB3|nr:ABC transporter substrate-binding protein [uncultured Methanolobus sp.]